MTSVLPERTHGVTHLSDGTRHLLDRRVRVPEYDRESLTPAVVHIGVGGFHRAHQAVYLDDLAASGETGWGEIGVGLRSPTVRDALVPQDGLFTVVERGARGDEARVVGAMTRYLYGPDDPEAVLAALADPRTRVVTLTVTGNGYHADLQPRRPSSTFGYLAAALDRRRRAGLPAFTVLSCDNLPDNGAAARTATLASARALGHGLAGWIDANATFPSSMVDRITPATDDAARALVAATFGVRDRSPVITEPFRQWVVQDAFCNGRPPLERAGVRFVPDVGPYQVMKTRLLNAGHSALGYLGHLTGRHVTTSDAMTDPVFAAYLAALMSDEIAGLLPEVPGIDLDDYIRTLLDRFANPRIGDRLTRLCGRGSTKMPAYLLPSLVAARAAGRPSALLTLAVAGWFRYLRGYDREGNRFDIADAHRDVLQPLAAHPGGDPAPLLRQRAIFGRLGDDPEFVEALRWAIRAIDEHGPEAAIADQLATRLLTEPLRRRTDDPCSSTLTWT